MKKWSSWIWCYKYFIQILWCFYNYLTLMTPFEKLFGYIKWISSLNWNCLGREWKVSYSLLNDFHKFSMKHLTFNLMKFSNLLRSSYCLLDRPSDLISKSIEVCYASEIGSLIFHAFIFFFVQYYLF